MPTAILFPGQGSQTPGMRDAVAERAPELLERLGDEPFERVGESTRFAQPAIYCAGLVGWLAAADELAEPPLAMAGHSLGELTALVAAGALDPFDGLDLVVLRGRVMDAAGGGTMLALLGAEPEQAQALADAHGVTVANDNAPGQVVLSGPGEALDAAAAAARADGLRALELGVAGAFHSPAMREAVAPFAEALRATRFAEPRVPVISCLTARPMRDPRAELADALTRPVLWRQTMRALDALGATDYVDVGPGRVLDKLVRRNLAHA